MATEIRHPEYTRRERERLVKHHSYKVCGNNSEEVVHNGAFVVAWDGDYDEETTAVTVGTLAEVRITENATTFRVSTGEGYELPYDHAKVIDRDRCPDVVYKVCGGVRIGKLVGIQEECGTGVVVEGTATFYIKLCNIAYCDKDIHFGIKIEEVEKEESDE